MKLPASFPVTIERLDNEGRGRGTIEHNGVTIDTRVLKAYIGETVIARPNKYRHKTCDAVTREKNCTPDVCPQFLRCGGCRFQWLDMHKQHEWKKTMVQELLRPVVPAAVVDALSVITTPYDKEYRNKIECTFYENHTLGFTEIGKFYEGVSASVCQLASQQTRKIITTIEQIWKHECPELTHYHKKKHTGVLRFLVVRHLQNADTGIITLVYQEPQTAEEQAQWKNFVQRCADTLQSQLDTSKWCFLTSESDCLWDRVEYTHQTIIFGTLPQYEILRDKKFFVTPSAFFQTNSAGCVVLYDTLRGMRSKYAAAGSTQILDLYCGTGTIGQYIAQPNDTIYGVDIEPSGIERAKINAEHNGVSASYFCGPAEKVLGTEPLIPTHFDITLIDPPRAGLHPKAREWITHTLQTDVCIYISCNPKTLKTDLAQLTETYDVLEAYCVDMFPQTHHVETVVVLKSRK